MEQLIRNVTTSITDQLSGNRSFYTPDDLRGYDIPEFLVQRVEVEIYRNLNESIVPPHSEWADMSAKEVEQAWEQFIDAIVAEVRMPSSFATTVFETAIADVMEMILQPRKSIPEILFGPKKTMTIDEVEKRLSFISVNAHLAQAIHKYMKRKNLEEIEIGTARRVVIKVDERITANYNSLNWAQLLQPLFILAGPKIDTELFRIFFKDRNMVRISRRFDLLSGSLNKIEFIETLSSPDLLNEEGYDDDQVSLFDVQAEGKNDKYENSSDKGKKDKKEIKKDASGPEFQDKDEIENSRSVNTEEKEPSSEADDSNQSSEGDKTDLALGTSKEDEENPDEDDDSIIGSFQNQPRSVIKAGDSGVSDDSESDGTNDEKTDITTDKEESEDIPLYIRFDEGVENTEEVDGEDEPEERFADRFFYDDESEQVVEDSTEPLHNTRSHDETEKEEFLDASEDETEAVDLSKEESSESGKESPIWLSFLGDDENVEEDDIPEFSEFADLLDEEENENEGEEDEEAPLIDLTVLDEEMDSADELIGWLKDDEDRFTSHIFSGSEKAYEEALIDLNQFDNWKQASRFIEKEIFARNLVDMYDEEAVDFTDRLQAYFDEYKS